jgi:putative chitinase
MITRDLMRRFVPKCPDTAGWADALSKAAVIGGIDTVRETQHWLAQLSVESKAFTDFEEDLWYTTTGMMRAWKSRFPTTSSAQPFAGNPKALANRVYNGRMGNRVGTNDGWHFRGRGPKQITGRNNYTAFEQWLASRGVILPIRTQPELLLTPEVGALSAAWFWKTNNLDAVLNRHALDDPAVVALTQVINGGQNGLEERQQALARIQKVWS